jgi:hypothetical protein
MFDWLKSLFGEGTLRFEFELTSGRTGTLKGPFIGAIESENELCHEMAQRIFVETGKRVKRIRCVGLAGRAKGAELITGKWYETAPF